MHRLIGDYEDYKASVDRLAELLSGLAPSITSRVDIAVVLAGIHFSAADPDLADLDDAQLGAVLLECSRHMVDTIVALPVLSNDR